MAAIGVLTLEIHVEDSHSLKDKRHVVKSLKDRLRERFNGMPVKHPGKTLWLESSGTGPNAKEVSYKRRWFD